MSDAAACVANEGFGLGAEWTPALPDDIAVVQQALAARNQTVSGVPHACYFTGLGQLRHASFWIFLFILIVTAIAQVKYLNDAIAIFDNTEVVPTHYVCFTLLSVLGATIVYREYEIPSNARGCPQWITLHFFLDGVFRLTDTAWKSS